MPGWDSWIACAGVAGRAILADSVELITKACGIGGLSVPSVTRQCEKCLESIGAYVTKPPGIVPRPARTSFRERLPPMEVEVVITGQGEMAPEEVTMTFDFPEGVPDTSQPRRI